VQSCSVFIVCVHQAADWSQLVYRRRGLLSGGCAQCTGLLDNYINKG